MVALLHGDAADFSDVTLDMRGIHSFDQRVYQITQRVLRGETLTYSDVAIRLGSPGAVRSVAQALARNPFVLIVPCHRVLEAGGYADRMSPHGGLISKRRLLSIEGAGGPQQQDAARRAAPRCPAQAA